MPDYVVYSALNDPKLNSEIGFGCSYLELWKDLPNLNFKKSMTRGSPNKSEETDHFGLRYKSDKNYIWVSPRTIHYLTCEPEALLVARGVRIKKGLYIPSVDACNLLEPFKDKNLDDCIETARKISKEYIELFKQEEEDKKRVRKKSLKK
jgi:hypothetical protein